MMKEIFLGSTLIVGMVCNTALACVWLKCIFKNPEATKYSTVPVLIAYTTTDLILVIGAMHFFKGGLPAL